MDWIARMNEMMRYIEANLDGEIDCEVIAQITACPQGLFQRIFNAVIGVSLGEYIRRRRLTLAAFELRATDAKVIDMAVKFGYDSADAFTAAFKRLHGVTPSAARQGEVNLKSYPCLTFTMAVKGVVEMDYRIVEKESFTAIGKVVISSHENNTIPRFWGECYQNGTASKLQGMAPAKPLLGICYGMESDKTFKYMAGIEAGEKAPAGMEALEIPKSTWAVFESIGPMPCAILSVWERIFSEFLPNSLYNHAGTPDLEVYFEGDNSADDYRCEVWIPVKPKQK